MSETRTVSPTLEERLAQIIRGRLVLARPPFGFPEVQALTDEILAAAKEHGLVIGEGELDAAWKEAEAALPEGWRGPVLRRSSIVEGQYQAQAFDPDDADAYEYADTPILALQALAAKLRDSRR